MSRSYPDVTSFDRLYSANEIVSTGMGTGTLTACEGYSKNDGISGMLTMGKKLVVDRDGDGHIVSAKGPAVEEGRTPTLTQVVRLGLTLLN